MVISQEEILLKYDISVDPKEIITSLNKSSGNEDNILWQTYDDNRNVFEIRDIEIDDLRSIVEFVISEDNAFVDLDKIAYIKLAHRNTIFKGDVIKITSQKVTMSIPDEVQLEEFREISRYHFNFKEKRTVQLSLESDLMVGASQFLKMQVMDISVQGLGLISSLNNKDMILNADDIYLHSLGDYKLPVEIKMKMAHSGNHRLRQDGKELRLFKLGTQLERHLEEELLNDYIARIEGRHEDEVGFLAPDEELIASIHDEMGLMFQKLQRNNNLAQVMRENKSKSFDRENYLQEHIRLLSKVTCGIANELGLYDKRTLKNLIYVTYTHDIAFFQNPKLALIKNDSHFMKVKDKLSNRDCLLYKKAFSYFEDFLESDSSGSKKALKIVQDFYKMRNNTQVVSLPDYSSLGCVFMVSHHLVDYIILRKNWSFYEYLESYPKYFRGGTFDLIYDALQSARLTSS